MTANHASRSDISQWSGNHWLLCAATGWLIFTVPASLVMQPVWRLLAFAVLTGAIFIAMLYELTKKDAERWRVIGAFAVIWLGAAATLYLANRFVPGQDEISGALIAGTEKTPATACGNLPPHNELLMVFG